MTASSFLASSLSPNETGIITDIINSPLRPRLLELGLSIGATIRILRYSPFKDPIELKVDDFFVGLRKSEADMILVQKI